MSPSPAVDLLQAAPLVENGTETSAVEAPALVELEVNPWESAIHRFNEAAELLKLDDGMRKVLQQPAMELTVHIPVMLDDGRIEVLLGIASSIRLPVVRQRVAFV